MNIHHLELFYYVARYGGITEAVRNFPYGIQQPAISAQLIRLEEHLGVTLFQRRPFALTKPGEELLQFISPFFSNLDVMADRLRGAVQQIRIGASELIQRDHLPFIIQNVQKKFPRFKLYLREGYSPQLMIWLQRQELDVIITVIEGKPFPGCHTQELIRLPLTLLVPKTSKLASADDLWKRDRIEEPLVALPAAEAICRAFQQELARRNIEWYTSLEASSLALVETYVVGGFGVGLSVEVPQVVRAPKVREIPLPGFPPVVIGAMWIGKRTALLDCFLDQCEERARSVRSAQEAAE